MTRTDYLNELLPSSFTVKGTFVESGPNSRKVYKNKPKDIQFIKKITKEKIDLDGAPILYFPIDPNSNDPDLQMDFDNVLKDHTHLILEKPIEMKATWTPQEYQLDLSKWGVIMPSGSDQQIYIHVTELEEKLKRKPLMGDIIETILDKTRYKVTDVFYGQINLWENIFCMLTLTKITYDNYTSQLDKYDKNYKETYTKLENVLNIMDGKEYKEPNQKILKEKKKTDSENKRRKKSIDTGLDLMTMQL